MSAPVRLLARLVAHSLARPRAALRTIKPSRRKGADLHGTTLAQLYAHFAGRIASQRGVLRRLESPYWRAGESPQSGAFPASRSCRESGVSAS
jgi:hypothetical protein